MNNAHLYERAGFQYYCGSFLETDGKFRGQIAIFGHRLTNKTFDPPIFIDTPATFVNQKDAKIEAVSYFLELTHSGQINSFLP